MKKKKRITEVRVQFEQNDLGRIKRSELLKYVAGLLPENIILKEDLEEEELLLEN